MLQGRINHDICMEPAEALRRLKNMHGVRGANRTSMRSMRGSSQSPIRETRIPFTHLGMVIFAYPFDYNDLENIKRRHLFGVPSRC